MKAADHIQGYPKKWNFRDDSTELYGLQFPYMYYSQLLLTCLFLWEIIKRMSSKQKTKFKLGIVLFKKFQVVFSVSSFVGTSVYTH